MRVATSEQIQEIDRLATARFGISSFKLMTNAGLLMAEAILSDSAWSRDGEVLILCGPGKNGGDGQVVAQFLRSQGVFVRVWPREVSSEDELPVLAAADFSGVKIPTTEEMARTALIVDALFGVGLNRPIEGLFHDLISLVNASGRPVVSLDVPSGLDADRGIAHGIAVRARRTLTCGLAKPGFFLQEGPAHAGSVQVLKIGFPEKLEKEIARDTFVIGRASARKLLPRVPSPTSNKTKFGRVLVIGGSPGMEGAAILSATAAARAGAGYVTLCTPETVPFDRKPVDFLTLKWDELSAADFTKYQAIVIGPGMGEAGDRLRILQNVVASGVKTVLDADALTLLSKHSEFQLHWNCVMTPHAGELSRLIAVDAKEIENNRLKFARAGALSRGGIALLKGYRTVVDNGLKAWIVNSGNVALAKAGSGDVLSGFIAGFAAQGMGLADASVLAAYLHGDIADRWVKSGKGSRTLMASDLPRILPKALKRLSAK